MNVTSAAVVSDATEMLSVIVRLGAVVSGVVPPPPHAAKNAAVEIAQAESFNFKVVTVFSLGKLMMKLLSSQAKKQFERGSSIDLFDECSVPSDQLELQVPGRR